MPHLPVRRPLLESNTELLEARARRLDVVAREGDVPEAFARFLVPARIPLEVGIFFCAVVMCELEYT